MAARFVQALSSLPSCCFSSIRRSFPKCSVQSSLLLKCENKTGHTFEIRFTTFPIDNQCVTIYLISSANSRSINCVNSLRLSRRTDNDEKWVYFFSSPEHQCKHRTPIKKILSIIDNMSSTTSFEYLWIIFGKY